MIVLERYGSGMTTTPNDPAANPSVPTEPVEVEMPAKETTEVDVPVE